MAQSLEETKSRLSAKYLGKCGVHGVGIIRDQEAVRFDIDEAEQNEAALGQLLEQARREAHPYKVITNKVGRSNTY